MHSIRYKQFQYNYMYKPLTLTVCVIFFNKFKVKC